MKKELLARLVRLSKNTGTPVILAEGDAEPVVVMGLDQYEELVGAYQLFEEHLENEYEYAPPQAPQASAMPAEQAEMAVNEPISTEELPYDEDAGDAPVLEDVFEKDEPQGEAEPAKGEEQFYLEPID